MPFGAAMLRGAVAAGARRFVPMPAVGVPVFLEAAGQVMVQAYGVTQLAASAG